MEEENEEEETNARMRQRRGKGKEKEKRARVFVLLAVRKSLKRARAFSTSSKTSRASNCAMGLLRYIAFFHQEMKNGFTIACYLSR